MRKRLERMGHECLEAGDGEEGERMALEHAPSVVFMDIMMPDQDGKETCKRLRAQGFTGFVALISALPEAAGMAHAREAGAGGYLAKPVETETLKAFTEYAVLAAANPDLPPFAVWRTEQLSAVGA